MDDLLRDELLPRAEHDQEARRAADVAPEVMVRVDAENLAWLKQACVRGA
jgi:hypothetical protein